jgi:hypothetical protein
VFGIVFTKNGGWPLTHTSFPLFLLPSLPPDTFPPWKPFLAKFFHGYGITRESINLGTTPDGRPSGEAWVTFPDMETGQVAVREKNRKHIGRF